MTLLQYNERSKIARFISEVYTFSSNIKLKVIEGESEAYIV